MGNGYCFVHLCNLIYSERASLGTGRANGLETKLEARDTRDKLFSIYLPAKRHECQNALCNMLVSVTNVIAIGLIIAHICCSKNGKWKSEGSSEVLASEGHECVTMC